MRSTVCPLRSRLLVRVAAVALVSGATAACSSDSTRFGDPFSNPFSSASSEPAPRQDTTASIQAAPSSRVERAPLGAPSAAQNRPMYGYGAGDGSYRQSRVEPQSTGSLSSSGSAIARPAAPATRASSNIAAGGGMTVTLGRGESLQTISRRYGVSASAIMQANGLSNANGVGEGTRLVIPAHPGVGGERVAMAPARPAPVQARPAPMRPAAVAAAPAPAAPKERMQFVQGAQPKGFEQKPVAAVKPVEPTKPAPAPKVAEAPALKPSVAASQPAPAKPVAAKPAAADDSVKTAALKVDPAPAAEPAGPSFRWPVRGRVISGYGSKASGSSNDGINLSVPEGTDVKASDDGVVAYSGSELKGFGNLVLIRHSNGWVTAYAHNSALNVKRGDTVRRGQIIAKSGSTGSVTSPQLHFEVRKGAQTVDPLKHLPDV
ncbi:LysM peptidoglycan-binding domain-containing M23 family metallopeptidase [Hansschlegelia zhihuaiae]|uniref:M23 family metallopeptidase n=1 Tax=Hansschlegelia zhihuaiae TaxID=405005 RepID=A0A4Q0MM74_9HYPH|nr:M23 family metallopeptidase [Hansschlegelia zhihuaiae]RXF74555.1 M23 family metallopeptidase [Hansschlegelia zhihuaiae]